MPRRTLIFDCDGVLVDSEPLAALAYVRAYARHGMCITEDVVAQCVGMKQADILARVRDLTGLVFPVDHLDDIWDETRRLFAERLQPMEGADAFLRQSSAPRCVASSSSIERITFSLKQTSLISHFGGRLFSSSMVARGKPAPDLFIYAAEQMGAAPGKCIVIEDSPLGVQGAVAAGMQALGFAGGGHSGPGHAETLRAAGATAIFASWRDLGTYLRAD